MVYYFYVISLIHQNTGGQEDKKQTEQPDHNGGINDFDDHHHSNLYPIFLNFIISSCSSGRSSFLISSDFFSRVSRAAILNSIFFWRFLFSFMFSRSSMAWEKYRIPDLVLLPIPTVMSCLIIIKTSGISWWPADGSAHLI